MPEPGIVAVIEDPFIRKLLSDILKRRGYTVREATVSGAVEMLRTGAVHVSVVITNTPAEFLPFHDQVPLLYLAAAPDAELAARFRRCRAVRKPFHTEELLVALRELAEAE